MKLNEQIKIIFIDCDYTAFDHENFLVRPLTIYAMKQLKKNGYKICISTSRNLDEMKAIDKRFIECADVLCTLAGAAIIYPDKKVLNTINKKDLIKVKEFLDKNNIVYRYATSDCIGYLNRNDNYVEKLFDDYFHMIPSIKKYENEDVLQIMYYTFDNSIHSKIKELVPDLVVNNMRLNNEISSSNVDKGSMMKDICSYFGYNTDQAMSFGDSENDETMLQNSYFGVCMENGAQSTKRIADYICEAQDEDGIYKTLVKYGFIKPYIEEDKEIFDEIIDGMYEYANKEKQICNISLMFKETIVNGGVIQMFGTKKSEQFCQELYYRAGGLVPFHKISLHDIEDVNDIVNKYILDDRDMYLLISETGNEKILLDICKMAKEKNQKIILVTRNKSNSISMYADCVLDLIDSDKPYRFTIDNTLAQMLSFQTYQLLKEDGTEPLIFMSNNNPDAKSHNEKVLSNYGERVHD